MTINYSTISTIVAVVGIVATAILGYAAISLRVDVGAISERLDVCEEARTAQRDQWKAIHDARLRIVEERCERRIVDAVELTRIDCDRTTVEERLRGDENALLDEVRRILWKHETTSLESP